MRHVLPVMDEISGLCKHALDKEPVSTALTSPAIKIVWYAAEIQLNCESLH